MLENYTRKPMTLRLPNSLRGKTETGNEVEIMDWTTRYPRNGGITVDVPLEIHSYNLSTDDELSTRIAGTMRPEFMRVDEHTAVTEQGMIVFIQLVAGISATEYLPDGSTRIVTYGAGVSWEQFLEADPRQLKLQHNWFAQVHDLMKITVHDVLMDNLRQSAYLLKKFDKYLV